MARRRAVLSEAVMIPAKLKDHFESEYGGIDSMVLEEVREAVNILYKQQEIARLRRTSTRRSITLYQIHQILFNLVFNY